MCAGVVVKCVRLLGMFKELGWYLGSNRSGARPIRRDSARHGSTEQCRICNASHHAASENFNEERPPSSIDRPVCWFCKACLPRKDA